MTRGSTPRQRLQRAVAVGAGIALVLGLLHLLGVGLKLLFALALLLAVVTFLAPWIVWRWFGDLRRLSRQRYWRGEQGRHHAFNGVPLHIEDDGRHSWIDGIGLQRALGTNEPEDAFAARFSERWRRDERGLLMLRVDAVVEHLSTAPGREERRRIRLCLYLEREVLYPAAQRQGGARQRPAGGASPWPTDPPSRRQ